MPEAEFAPRVPSQEGATAPAKSIMELDPIVAVDESKDVEDEKKDVAEQAGTANTIATLKEQLGGEDVMELLDVLSEAKQQKDFDKICDIFKLLGLITLENESERDSMCDFDGIVNMVDVVRACWRYTPKTAGCPIAERIQKYMHETVEGEEGDKFDEKMSSLECYKNLYQKYDEFLFLDTPSESEVAQLKLMTAFCNSLKGIAYRSNLNRGILREQHAVEEVVCFLEYCFKQTTQSRLDKEILQPAIVSGCIAIKALCAGNDGNKKVAAGISGVLNQEGLANTDCLDPSVPTMAKGDEGGGKCIDLLLLIGLAEDVDGLPEDVATTRREILKSTPVQAHSAWGIRALVTDDDSRGQGSMVPSAVENRDYVANRVNFPKIRQIIIGGLKNLKADMDRDIGNLPEEERSLTKSGQVLSPLQWYRLEGVLLLMKEVGCHQERIHKFVLEDNVLPLIKDTLAYGHASIVRACLYVLRQFAFSDHMKDLFTWGDAGITTSAALVLKKFSDNVSIVEQCFGLFSNVSLRKPVICEILHADPLRITAMGVLILGQYKHHAGISTTVLYTLRNISKSVPSAAQEVEDSGFFPLVRDIYFAHENDMTRQWLAAKDIAKQFLREFREDTEGMRRKIEYNDFY